ncbi:MBL fold metallo-hydrolase [Vibrio chagasii]|nr:MBL fold metallo-hydrolase [Vibrio chagasii]
MSNWYPAFEDFSLTELMRDFPDLRTVVVTRMHPDHAGAAHKLKLTSCNLVAANREMGLVCPVSWYLDAFDRSSISKMDVNHTRKTEANLWYSRKLKPDYKLSDGESIPGFDDWLVLETPGHTDRDLSVYCPSHSVAYVANLMVEVKKKLIPPFLSFTLTVPRKSVSRIC